MYEHTFVTIPVKRTRAGLVADRDYREIVREQAALGWKFEQAISFEQHATPRLDLVFSRKVRK